MTAPFDRVVLSTDDNPLYREFVPLTIAAWRKFFPEVKVTLAAVSVSHPDDLAQYADDCVHFDPRTMSVNGVRPESVYSANIAKMSRYTTAGMFPGEVCCIHDIDSVPLQRDYGIHLLSQREPGRLLCVGAEVYVGTESEGKFPAGWMTGEGELFAVMMSGYDPLESVFDDKENVFSPPPMFSDESLVRAQIHRSAVNAQHVQRGVSPEADWVDRAWWVCDRDKLFAGGYTDANMLRPWSRHIETLAPMVEYICST